MLLTGSSKIKEQLILVSERSLETNLAMLRACFSQADLALRRDKLAFLELDGSGISLENALPSALSKLSLISDFERSSDVTDNLRAVLNLLGCLHSDLGEFARTTLR